MMCKKSTAFCGVGNVDLPLSIPVTCNSLLWLSDLLASLHNDDVLPWYRDSKRFIGFLNTISRSIIPDNEIICVLNWYVTKFKLLFRHLWFLFGFSFSLFFSLPLSLLSLFFSLEGKSARRLISDLSWLTTGTVMISPSNANLLL